MHNDTVTLIVPARSEFAKTVRMTAATLVSRTDMNYDEVEDVRMAADEAFVYAVETLEPGDDVRFEFQVIGDLLTIDVSLGESTRSTSEEAERSATYATFILESVCDSYQFVSDDSGAHLRLTKQAGTVHAS